MTQPSLANAEGRQNPAVDFVRETLLDVLPDGVLPSFCEIVSAGYVGTGNKRRAIAHLIMFDGMPAYVECWQDGPCRAHRFTELPGGSISWENGTWTRCDDVAGVIGNLPLFMLDWRFATNSDAGAS